MKRAPGRPDRRELVTFEIPLGLMGLFAVASAFVFAHTGTPDWIPPALLVLFGVPSPLSGMTRSFVALAGGDVHGAFGWHPLGPVAFVVAAAAPVVACVSWARGRRVPVVERALRSRALWIALGVALALAWVRQILVLDT